MEDYFVITTDKSDEIVDRCLKNESIRGYKFATNWASKYQIIQGINSICNQILKFEYSKYNVFLVKAKDIKEEKNNEHIIKLYDIKYQLVGDILNPIQFGVEKAIKKFKNSLDVNIEESRTLLFSFKLKPNQQVIKNKTIKKVLYFSIEKDVYDEIYNVYLEIRYNDCESFFFLDIKNDKGTGIEEFSNYIKNIIDISKEIYLNNNNEIKITDEECRSISTLIYMQKNANTYMNQRKIYTNSKLTEICKSII